MTAVSTKRHGRYALTRPPRDDEELHGLVYALWGVNIPRTRVCDDHVAPFEWFSDCFFRRVPLGVALGSRGLSGKSYAMSALGLTTSVVLGVDVNLLGGSLAQSMNLHTHMQAAWESDGAPRYMIQKLGNTEIKLTNKSRITPLTASQKTVRGPHPAQLCLDEIDEMDPEIYESALGQPMDQVNHVGVTIGPQVAVTSTLQYADGNMMRVMNEARERGLGVYSWCYHESANPVDGWLTQEQILHKKQTVSRERWRVEYELGEPSIGNRAFHTPDVETAFNGDPADGLVKQSRDYEEYGFETFKLNEDYIIAADWARSQDMTVITVWKATRLPMELVYYVRMNHLPWPVMIKKFNVLQKKFRATGIHDATGLGDVVASLIDGDVWDFKMTGAQRDDMLSEYVAAVERGKVSGPRINSLYTAHKYCSVEDLFSRSKEFHLPDEVCSAALAWQVAGERFPDVFPLGLPKTDNNWMAKAVDENKRQLGVKSPLRIEGEVKSTEAEIIGWDSMYT